jgi:cell division protein ZapE
LSRHFEVHRIEGEDYRHRGRPTAPDPESDARVHEAAAAHSDASLDHFVDLCRHLPQVHPSRYGALLDGLAMVCLEDVRQVDDQALALRLVVLADRLYDRDLPVVASGIALDRLFAEEMLGGGYRKKYFRAISRLTALAREGAEQAG